MAVSVQLAGKNYKRITVPDRLVYGQELNGQTRLTVAALCERRQRGNL